MASVLLTDSKIRGLKPKKSAYYTWQASATRGTGRLGVKTYPSGRKVFVYRYFRESKEKFISLGDYPTLSLADAAVKSVAAAAESPAETPQGLWIINIALVGIMTSSPTIAMTEAIDAANPSI